MEPTDRATVGLQWCQVRPLTNEPRRLRTWMSVSPYVPCPLHCCRTEYWACMQRRSGSRHHPAPSGFKKKVAIRLGLRLGLGLRGAGCRHAPCASGFVHCLPHPRQRRVPAIDRGCGCAHPPATAYCDRRATLSCGLACLSPVACRPLLACLFPLQQKAANTDVKISDFSSSFQDGLAFCAIMHGLFPTQVRALGIRTHTHTHTHTHTRARTYM